MFQLIYSPLMVSLALQLHILLISESMGFHDSEVMDDRNII